MKNEIIIKNIDFSLLKKQKRILLNMIMDWGESNDPNQAHDASEAEGLLELITNIQDYAVDVLGYEENEVFNFEN
jgi:hypothetical protein